MANLNNRLNRLEARAQATRRPKRMVVYQESLDQPGCFSPLGKPEESLTSEEIDQRHAGTDEVVLLVTYIKAKVE